VIAGAAVLLGLNLGGYGLWDPDEAKHAEVAREMLLAGRWLEPTINFAPYHHKPSLLYLLIGLAYRVLGVTELAARLVPALAAAATLAIVYWHGSRTGVRRGLVSAGLLGSCAFFVLVGRFTNFDALVTAALTAAAFTYASWMEGARLRPPYATYALVGLGVLVKGPMALALLSLPIAFTVFTREVSAASLGLVRGGLLVVAIVGAWALPVSLHHWDYLRDFIWIHNVKRYLGGTPGFHDVPLYVFVPVIVAALLPWSPLSWFGARWGIERGGSERFLTVYALWVVAFFCLSSGKLATYVLPAVPALAYLVGAWLDGAAPGTGRRTAGVCAALAAAVTPVAYLLFHQEARGFEAYAAVFAPASMAGATVVAMGRRRLPSSLRAMTIVCSGVAATLLAFVCWGAGGVSRYTSDRGLAEAAMAVGKPDRFVAYGVRPYSFIFYTGWRAVYDVDADDYRGALEGQGRTWVLTKEKRLAGLHTIAPLLAYQEVARNRRHVLLEVRRPSNHPNAISR
jgi:4-amino-4-deoxy-L-arabinose transferase-like glycosyltransferase